MNCHQQVGYQPSKNLNHEAIFTSSNQMINLKMLLPPFEKALNVPPEFIDSCYLLCGQIVPISGNIVFAPCNLITNNPNRIFCLILTRCAEEYQGIIKNIAVRLYGVFFYDCSRCFGFDAANKMFIPVLEQIKIPMTGSVISVISVDQWVGLTQVDQWQGSVANGISGSGSRN